MLAIRVVNVTLIARELSLRFPSVMMRSEFGFAQAALPMSVFSLLFVFNRGNNNPWASKQRFLTLQVWESGYNGVLWPRVAVALYKISRLTCFLDVLYASVVFIVSSTQHPSEDKEVTGLGKQFLGVPRRKMVRIWGLTGWGQGLCAGWELSPCGNTCCHACFLSLLCWLRNPDQLNKKRDGGCKAFILY